MIKKPQIQIDEILPKTLGVQIAKTFVARLGDPAQGYKVKVDSTDKKGLVYIHGIGDTPNSAYTAENRVGLTELLPRSLVEVGYTETGRFKIVGFAPENSEYIDGVNINDQTPVYRNQILDGGLIANDSNNVQYIGTYYVVNGIVYLTSDQTTGNLIDGSTDDTSAVAIQPPSTPQTAIVVLVQINPVTNVISYKQSSAFPASYSNRLIASNSLYPQPDDNNAITGYIRLINGVTTIKQEHITSLPDIYRINRGEANTASNIGIDGVGVFDGKVGVDLQFRNINAGSTKISVTDDSANNEIDIDVSESDLTLDNIGGTLSVVKGGTGSTTASGARTNLDAQEDLSGAIITSATVATDDKILIQDTDDSDNLKTVTVQSVADLASTITTPASSTDNAIVRFDGTGGDSIQNSGVLIDDNDRLTLPDSTTIPPLNITERSAEPTTPSSNDIYLDDGTNTSSGNPSFRRYTGSVWEDIGGGSGGSLNYVETTTATTSYSTTSTSPTAIDTTNLRLSITTTGGRVFVGFVGSRLTQSNNYNNTNFLGVLISSTYYSGAVNSLSDNNNVSGTPANFLIPMNLGAGTHTIDLAFYTENATTAVNLYEADEGLFYAYEA